MLFRSKVVIKIKDANDKLKGNVKSRPTIKGLSQIYYHIISDNYDLNSDKILRIVKNHGIPEGIPIDNKYLKNILFNHHKLGINANV